MIFYFMIVSGWDSGLTLIPQSLSQRVSLPHQQTWQKRRAVEGTKNDGLSPPTKNGVSREIAFWSVNSLMLSNALN